MKITWSLIVKGVFGSGHGSLLLPDNCGEKKKLEDNPELTIGDPQHQWIIQTNTGTLLRVLLTNSKLN
ncbi:unnamed protein product [Leptidea sinapis]|uniref:Uncharacterized protein n=1 Tax=Leptidea sinapis TaxID=189913 RepID=A0A5E4R0T8_9NEOP|nr:unnamed protein product [Leptidea sinapis]